jgi:hypothetical protein
LWVRSYGLWVMGVIVMGGDERVPGLSSDGAFTEGIQKVNGEYTEGMQSVTGR